MKDLNEETVRIFREHLVFEEKSRMTVQKYTYEASQFLKWLQREKGREQNEDVQKMEVLEYKALLCKSYAPSSVNVAIASLNSFFDFCERYDLRVKNIRIQHQTFVKCEKELSDEEYKRLLQSAKERGDERLYYIMQTLCSTGMRVSELNYITVESLSEGAADIDCKGKRRTVIIPQQLCEMLREYAREKEIREGAIFVTSSGKPVDRSNVWADMKELCEEAEVNKEKVYPHNLRHLFARTYYEKQKDIVRLADILGHSSVNTTRIYTIESGEEHRRQIQSLGLLFQ